MLLSMSAPTSAQSPSEPLTDPTPFEIGYGMSFVGFDACGDAEAGRIFRRALLDKLAQCPFTPEARAEFQNWRLETLEDLIADLWQGYSRGESPRGPPELYGADGKPNGMTCADYRSTPRYQDRRAALLRYQRREIGVDDVFGSECPSGPAAL